MVIPAHARELGRFLSSEREAQGVQVTGRTRAGFVDAPPSSILESQTNEQRYSNAPELDGYNAFA